ncbi:MAG: sugar ABC transporter permease, partial [Mycetocola sp.]
MDRVLGDKRAIFVLLGPALLVYSLVMLVPILWSLGYTVFDGNPIVGFTFNGLGNFTKFFQDPAAWSAIWFTIRYALVLTILQVGTGFGLSLLYVFWLKKASSTIRT